MAIVWQFANGCGRGRADMVRWAVDTKTGFRRVLARSERPRPHEIVIKSSCGPLAMGDTVRWLIKSGFIHAQNDASRGAAPAASELDLRERAI